MKNWFLAVAMMIASTLALAPMDADARRFGGGKSSGMQRAAPPPSMPTRPAQAAPNAAPNAAGAAAAAGKRSWMGPIAGLAAGLGLAALMSHLGMGEEFANMIMIALLVVVAFVAVRWLMRRMGPPQAASARPGDLAAAGPGKPWNEPPRSPAAPVMQRAGEGTGGAVLAADGKTVLGGSGAAAVAPAADLPAGFDREAFERIAKMIFIRMQAANDTGDLNDLRTFTTPEMFAVVKLDLQERGDTKQTTDVVKVDADVLDVAQEGQQQIVSVRFHGQIREDIGAAAVDFDEVWHLTRFGDQPNWSIAGIQQRQ